MLPSIGTIRRLQRCASATGHFVILALDHRNNLRQALNPADPGQVGYNQMVAFKKRVTSLVAPSATAVLLDPEFGAAQAIAAGAVPRETGLVVAVEETGYTGEPTDRRTSLLPGWSVGKIARMGADGVKLLVYYHPDGPGAAGQEGLVAEVAEACRRLDMPLFLEPLSFSLDRSVKKLPPAELRRVVVETARRLTPLGCAVLKAEFPVNIAEEPDEGVWLDACAELSAASRVPWVLLSAGVSFADFERQTAAACRGGASGVMAGRAVWKEAVGLDEAGLQEFLATTATGRMASLAAICADAGRPWTEFYPGLAQSVGEGWYQEFGA
jgi:tagatose-1,6-bisphosphate aldolase